jgi:hypothetical protein
VNKISFVLVILFAAAILPSIARADCGNYSFVTPAGASADSVYSERYPVSNTIDSNTGTYWRTNTTAYPQWIYFDLGQRQCMNAVKVYVAYQPYVPKRMTIEVSDDAANWKAVGGINISSYGAYTTKAFNETTARYLRLNIYSGSAAATVINEVKISAASGSGSISYSSAPTVVKQENATHAQQPSSCDNTTSNSCSATENEKTTQPKVDTPKPATSNPISGFFGWLSSLFSGAR